jgi:hypothetical protein
MLPALHDNQRTVMFRWGMLVMVASIALGPLSGSPANVAATRSPGEQIQAELKPLPGFTLPALPMAPDPFTPRAAVIPSGTVVHAVVFGGSPRALIQIGSRESIVGVGDTIVGVRVMKIDDRGVLLSDGSFIPLRSARP